MRALLPILLIVAFFSSAACGGGVVDVSDEGGARQSQKAGTAFISGGAHSSSASFKVDHRINITPTDGVQRSSNYESRPGY